MGACVRMPHEHECGARPTRIEHTEHVVTVGLHLLKLRPEASCGQAVQKISGDFILEPRLTWDINQIGHHPDEFIVWRCRLKHAASQLVDMY